MSRPGLGTWAIGLAAAAVLAALGVRATAPEPSLPPVRLLAFAAPGAIVAGERATAFGAFVRTSTLRTWHQLEVCPAESRACTRLAPVEVAGGAGDWVGAAGHIALTEPGRYVARWHLFVDAGADTPSRVDGAETAIVVLAGGDRAAP